MQGENYESGSRILFVDDEPSILKSLRRATRSLNTECVFVDSGAQGLNAMAEDNFDLVVSDMRMPEMDGSTFLAEVAKQYPETIRLVLTGFSEEDLVMRAINEGRIWGFIKKPWDEDLLLATLQQAIQAQQIIAERALLRRTVERYTREHKNNFMGFVGSSMAMQFVYNTIERSANSDASVFITGPSGTGKEVCAEAIHKLGKRSNGPFIALNCAAIPSELMESEIFGHIKGAFSGAVSNRDGAAIQAHGGTLFLDELAEMDISLQAKLLRFIQTGTVQKVGASKTEKVDIRFICATNRPPLDAIDKSLLREDLYYRLNVVSINMPALKERDEDILLLAHYFLDKFSEKEQKKFAGFSSSAERLMLAFDWPGNVRQLENCTHSAVVMSNGPLITEEVLGKAMSLEPRTIESLVSSSQDKLQSPQLEAVPSPLASTEKSTAPKKPIPKNEAFAEIRPLHEVERQYVEYAISYCNGNVVKAASILEVSPSTLYRKIQNWGNADTELQKAKNA